MSEAGAGPVRDATGGGARPVARGELVFAAFLLVVGVVVLLDARTLPAGTAASGIGPGFFPTVVAVLTMVVAVALAADVLRGNHGEPDPGEGDVDASAFHGRSVLIVVGAVAVHGLLLERAGYILTAALTFWAIAYAIGARRLVRDAVVSLVLAVVVYVVFTRGLSIDLPAGLIGGV